MRAWNRAKLLWGYLSRQTKLKGLPVEYIVETTAKCNLYCPMCPRETHKQPKEDMTDDIFERLVRDGEQTVRALTDRAGVSQPAVSKHLGVLKLAGLVRDRPEGGTRPRRDVARCRGRRSAGA